MATKFDPGEWLWIQDETERFLPAKALTGFAGGDETTVRTEDGEDHKLDKAASSWATPCSTQILDSNVEDLINISDLSEMAILHSLRIRFREDKIYTNISSILISVNPFRLLPLFTPEVLAQYRDGNHRELPPHIFTTANQAYAGMLNEKVDQSVVISGESGAGKSEAMKLILQFLTDVSARADTSKGDNASAPTGSSNLEQKILAANPILEAFGNAKTSRNHNSSRFGKLITINFDSAGAIIGGGIINYLLEKSRVVQQNLDERNYHIFYQLLTAAGTDAKLSQKLKLQSPELFNITNPQGQGVVTIPNHSDEKEFEDTQNSMRVLHFTDSEKSETYQIVAGVLHFGNIKFVAKGDDSCEIANEDDLAHGAAMFGVDADAAKKVLTSRLMGAHSVVVVPYSVEQAHAARDAMIKRVYSDLFQIMVDKINAELSSAGKARANFIGVLDIFGFESFAVNSFEQLCINYCNEKLQFHFNEHIFKMEQTLYAAEGIDIPGSSFVDNQTTLDLLELKGTGVFSMIDEEINVPRGSDEGLLGKLLTKHKDHDHMVQPRGKVCKDSQKCFGIDHYAGKVYYNITNFLEKNKDQLHPDIENVLRDSNVKYIAKMFAKKEGDEPSGAGRRGAAGAKKGKTLGGQFKAQLIELVDTLNKTVPNFVRCMKSNDQKVGRIFESKRMQDQLRYSGLVEVCRIRKLGFPVRREFEEFFKRYKCVDLTVKSLDEQLASLQSKGILKQGEWAKGNTRVFLRTGQSTELEVYREIQLTAVAIRVQSSIRRCLTWWHFKRMMKIVKSVHAAIEAREEEVLHSALEACAELPWDGSHMAVVKEAKALLNKVKEENRVLKLLEAAIESKDLSTLKNAMAEAATNENPKLAPLRQRAQEMVTRIEAENVCKQGMIAATTSRSIPDLQKYMAEAEKLEMTDMKEYTNCASTLKRRHEEEDALAELKKAGESDLEALEHALSKCNSLGMSSHPAVTAAIAVKNKILAERSAAEQEAKRAAEAAAAAEREEMVNKMHSRLEAAMQNADGSSLNDVLNECTEVGVESDTVTKARKMAKDLSTLDDVKANLVAAAKVLTVKAQLKLTESDFKELTASIAEAKNVKESVPSLDFPDLAAAEKTLQDFQAHIPHYAVLEAALQSNDRLILRDAVSNAENLNMTTDTFKSCKELLRSLEIAYRDEKNAAGEALEPEPTEENYDEAEEARRAKREVAKQPKFEFRHFIGLRSLDDFARGFLLSKNRVKEGMLVFTDQAMPKSLTKLDSVKNKRALELLLNIQGYMGDKHMPYPAMLAQDVLKTAINDKDMRDEVYCQIIKQITQNSRAESVAKGWQLLCMCVGHFPPSFDMEYYLLHYIITKSEGGRGAVVDYAKYCLRTLEGILSSGDFGCVPSTEEILAFKERPPILATIYLVDGREVIPDLPITPDLNVGRILTLCSNWLGLTGKGINTLGIFVYDEGPIDASKADNAPYADLERTPRSLRNEDYMGDVTVLKARQKRNFKFVLKRKLFLPDSLEGGEDAQFDRLTYIQAEDDALTVGNIFVEDVDTVANLAAISMTVQWGDEVAEDVAGLIEQEHLTYIAPDWREECDENEWAERILNYLPSCAGVDPDELQDMFVTTLQKFDTYGMHFFNIKLARDGVGKLSGFPRLLMYGFNHVGLTIFDMDREPLTTFAYSEIHRWGGSSSQFSLILADESVAGGTMELVVITAQAQDIAAVILDHIRALMKASGK